MIAHWHLWNNALVDVKYILLYITSQESGQFRSSRVNVRTLSQLGYRKNRVTERKYVLKPLCYMLPP